MLQRNLTPFLIALSFLVIMPLLGLIYPLLNNPDRGVSILVTDLDLAIPFLKIFVIPYLFWYPFLGLSMVYLCAVDRDTYYRTLLSYVISVLACFVTYYFFQTTVPLRPVLTEDDWLSRLVQYVYQNDQPYNCFPSIHCFSCYLMFKAFRENRKTAPWIRASVQICAVVIILSTLFVKQHVLLDVAGSIFLVEGAQLIVSRLWNTLNLSERQFVRRPSRKTVALPD